MCIQKTNVEKSIKQTLATYCNTPSKRSRSKNPAHTKQKQIVFSVAGLMDTDFNWEPYFWRLTFPLADSLEEELHQVADFIKEIASHACLSKEYMVVGGIISVEAHKNSTLKKKTGKNTKAVFFQGSPSHALMVLG